MRQEFEKTAKWEEEMPLPDLRFLGTQGTEVWALEEEGGHRTM